MRLLQPDFEPLLTDFREGARTLRLLLLVPPT